MDKVVPTTVVKDSNGQSFVVEDLPVQIRRLVELYDEFREKHVQARVEYESAIAAERYFELATKQAIGQHLEDAKKAEVENDAD